MVVSARTKKGRGLKAKGDKSYLQRKWKKALEAYQQASEEMPEDIWLTQRIGDVQQKLGDKYEAARHYKVVASRYAEDGFWAKAIAMTKMVMTLDPTDLTLQKKMAEMYSAQGLEAKTKAATPPPPPPSSPKDRQAISIVGAEPRTMDQPEDPTQGAIGATLPIENVEPQVVGEPSFEAKGPTLELQPEDEVSTPESRLGTPIQPLAGIPLFSEMNPEEVLAMFERLAVRRYPAEALVCEEGDAGRSMFILTEGKVEVFTRDPGGRHLTLTHLRGGDFFGEFGLLTNGQRNASVQAKSEVEALEITAADFDVIAAKHPRIWDILKGYVRRRVIDTTLMKSEVFRALKIEERNLLATFLRGKKFPPEVVVMEEGTSGEEMYLVRSGRLAVSLKKGTKHIAVGEIGPGDYFGEVAMLTGKPRTATVRSKTDAELLVLTRTDAAKVLKGNSEILNRLKEKMNRRAQETADVSRTFTEARTTLELV